MSSADAAEAMAKLQHLSEARAERVLSVIEDLSELEALENAVDVKAAREALAAGEEPLPWAEVKAKLDAQFGLPHHLPSQSD